MIDSCPYLPVLHTKFFQIQYCIGEAEVKKRSVCPSIFNPRELHQHMIEKNQQIGEGLVNLNWTSGTGGVVQLSSNWYHTGHVSRQPPDVRVYITWLAMVVNESWVGQFAMTAIKGNRTLTVHVHEHFPIYIVQQRIQSSDYRHTQTQDHSKDQCLFLSALTFETPVQSNL